jgi:putative phosphonate transport system ATP-binding protein
MTESHPACSRSFAASPSPMARASAAGRVLRPLSRRGDGHRRRIRLGQIHAAQLPRRASEPDAGRCVRHPRRRPARHLTMSEPERRMLGAPTGPFVHQNPRDGLRMRSRRRQCGRAADGRGRAPLRRHPAAAIDWLAASRSTPTASTTARRSSPAACSSACRSRATSSPGRAGVHGRADRRARCVGAGAPARPAARLVRTMGLSAIIVTHDLAVARLLADRLMVMKDGHVVETGLTDQVLDDPQHAYTQLLVSRFCRSIGRGQIHRHAHLCMATILPAKARVAIDGTGHHQGRAARDPGAAPHDAGLCQPVPAGRAARADA